MELSLSLQASLALGWWLLGEVTRPGCSTKALLALRLSNKRFFSCSFHFLSLSFLLFLSHIWAGSLCSCPALHTSQEPHQETGTRLLLHPELSSLNKCGASKGSQQDKGSPESAFSTDTHTEVPGQPCTKSIPSPAGWLTNPAAPRAHSIKPSSFS